MIKVKFWMALQVMLSLFLKVTSDFEEQGDDKCCLGVILDFSFINRKSVSTVRYHHKSVDISDILNSNNPRSIGVICNCFNVKTDRSLEYLDLSCHGYYDMKYFWYVLRKPMVCNAKYVLSLNLYNQIKPYI